MHQLAVLNRPRLHQKLAPLSPTKVVDPLWAEYNPGLRTIATYRWPRARPPATRTGNRLSRRPRIMRGLALDPAARSSGRRDRPRDSCASCRCQNRSRRQTARAGTVARRHDKISISWPFVTHINGGWVLQWGAFATAAGISVKNPRCRRHRIACKCLELYQNK